MVALEVQSLAGKIGEFYLGPVDMVIPEGSITGILGPSGCGKTLLLRMIAGLHEPVRGKVLIDGKDMTDSPPSERRIAFIFQDEALFPHFNTYNNVAFPLKIKKDRLVDEKVRNKAHELDGLYEYLDLKPSQLPAGIRKLTAIGRETLREYSLILMDEPFERLDRKIRGELRVMVKKLLLHIGKSVLIILNDPEDAMSITDRLYVMTDGSFIRNGNPREVYENPGSAETLELMSPHGTNTLGDMIFRPEDVELSEAGIKAVLVHSSPLDGKKALCSALIDNNPVMLILPAEVTENTEITLKITKSYSFGSRSS